MVFVFFLLWALLKVFAVKVAEMQRISIDGQDVNFDPPGDEINPGDLLMRMDAMASFVNAMANGAQTLSENMRAATQKHLTDAAATMTEMNDRNRALVG